MKVEATRFFWRAELGFDLELRSRTVETHSRMQNLSPEKVAELKHMLDKMLEKEIFDFVIENTISTSA